MTDQKITANKIIQLLAVIVEAGLASQDVRDKLDTVFGVQETFDMAVGE